ncbi:MAG: NAD(P)-dependent oxidoreductase, partial [Deltaproteobacteria bacterium]|nr:NAD(P)-dependent oxidoreductase [Deltaproteobacteria bacterium]
RTILITGATGQVAFPIARELARNNRVLALGRFQKEEDRARIEGVGAEAVVADLVTGNFSSVPTKLDAVLHFAVARSSQPDFDGDLAMNAEGVGLLMAHCKDARAFLHCSTAGVYQAAEGEPRTEGDPLGDHHRVMMPTYSLAKIAAEAVVRFAARHWKLPTTIARLGVPYGDEGGWPWYHLMMMKSGVPIPVHPDGPNRFPLFHEDDYLRSIEGLLEMASVPATLVNWAGSEDTCIEEWCAYLGELTGLEPKLTAGDQTLAPLPLDVSKLEARVGPSQVSWREGLRRMVEARNPELLAQGEGAS